ncbi:MAG: HAMP domain-containing histidine kinase [Brumimicrobium sp.]|nr:HAMP domain-containing histidine kinase [Brumimicrobium sp.]
MVILIGVLSIISILLVQVLWINRTIRAQKDAIIIQERQDSLNTRQFEESVRVALRNVVEQISTANNIENIDLYGSVKQKSSNYFLVDINENLHPYYLEQLLKRTFYQHNIYQNFQYGIYDCYNDSIIYGNLIQFTRDSLFAPTDKGMGIPSSKMEWKKDGHYFTVYFPNIESNPLDDKLIALRHPWIYVGIVAILLLIFFTISIFVIIRQKRISEIKTDFVNNMTHELKTPISTIGLSSEMLLHADFAHDAERVKKYAEVIYKENKRLEKQVERVLNMARLDRNDLELKFEDISLHGILQEIAENIKFNQNQDDSQIGLSLQAENDMVYADPIHLANIFLNLVDNAQKYCEKTPEIKISSKNVQKGIEITVQDNGIGISEEQISQIFDQFYRVPTGNKHDVKGFGLGLYYVKLIVEKHNGKINVNSKIGEGSIFTIWLPIIYNKI